MDLRSSQDERVEKVSWDLLAKGRSIDSIKQIRVNDIVVALVFSGSDGDQLELMSGGVIDGTSTRSKICEHDGAISVDGSSIVEACLICGVGW